MKLIALGVPFLHHSSYSKITQSERFFLRFSYTGYYAENKQPKY